MWKSAMSSQSPTPPSTRSPISTSWTVRLWVPQTSKITWGSRLMAGWDGTSTSITSAVQQTGCSAFSGGTCTSALKTWRRRPTRPRYNIVPASGTPTNTSTLTSLNCSVHGSSLCHQPALQMKLSVTAMIQDLGWEPLWMGRLQCRLTSFYKVVNNHLKIAQSYHPQPAQGLRSYQRPRQASPAVPARSWCLQVQLLPADSGRLEPATGRDSSRRIRRGFQAESLLFKTVASSEHMFIALYITFFNQHWGQALLDCHTK